MNIPFEIQELKRRFENLQRVATIIEVDADAGLVRVEDGAFKSKFVPWLERRAAPDQASWDPPSVGERCLFFCMSAETGNGYALPGIYCDDNPAPTADPNLVTRTFPDGGRITYNHATSIYEIIPSDEGRILLKVNQAFISVSGSDLEVSAPNVLINATDATLVADNMVVNSPTINLGGAGGAKVARVGDDVNLSTGKIIGGSDVVKAI